MQQSYQGWYKGVVRTVLVPILLVVGCSSKAAKPVDALTQAQEEYVADVMAFTHETHDQVRERMHRGSVPLKEEWESWEKQGPMTDERGKAFYKQTRSYMYELGEWHLWVPGKRASDEQLVKDVLAMHPKNVLDFGGGVGLNAIMLARAGLDVTLADLDGTSLAFAQTRMQRHGVKMKFWKTDVEPMPPDKKYDVILTMDVLEHLPSAILEDTVNKLISLKTDKTQIVLEAPFGKNSVFPMHIDADEHTHQQVARLQHELPPN